MRRKRGAETSELLTWDDGPAWEIWLDVREEEDGGCSLTGSLRRGEERLAFSEPSLLLSSGHLFQIGQVSRLDLAGFVWIPLLARAGWSLRVPAGEKEDLLERLLSATRSPPARPARVAAFRDGARGPPAAPPPEVLPPGLFQGLAVRGSVLPVRRR